MENAQRTLERHRELFISGGLSQEQLEQSEDQVILKEQAVYVSKAKLDDLKEQPKKKMSKSDVPIFLKLRQV